MHLRAFFLVPLFVSSAALADQRLPFSFDPSLAANPSSVQTKTANLDRALPAAFHLPATFETLASAPDGVAPPTTTLWFSPEVKNGFLRASAAGTTPMSWTGTWCPRHRAFSLPTGSLLAAGAPSICTSSEAAVRQTLSASALAACEDVEQPERYVLAGYRIAPGTSQSAINSFVDARTNNLEQMIGLVGAALSTFPVPDGLLPPDWVPTLRSIVWKIRPAVAPARVSDGRSAFAQVLEELARNASCFDPTLRASLESQVRGLDDELAAAGANVSRLLNDAAARAAQQAQCLANTGRTRPALPVPTLTDEEREFIGFWLGGVYWRMRGGGLIPLGSTQNARTFYARRPFRELARLANGTQVAEHAADALYCNLQEGWGDWMDMGVTPGGQDAYEDLVDMTDRGRRQVAGWGVNELACGLVAGVSKSPEAYLRGAGFDTADLFAGGLSMGPCYLYSLNPMKSFAYAPQSATSAPYSGFLGFFTEIGEFCTGASLGLGLTRTLLKGTPSGAPVTNACGTRRCGTDACGVSCGTCATGLQCLEDGTCGTPPVEPVDAGSPVDAGAESIDAGASEVADAGGESEPDAGMSEVVDAGDSAPMDAGTGADSGAPRPSAGGEDTVPPGGCQCGSGAAGVALLGMFVRRRRPKRV